MSSDAIDRALIAVLELDAPLQALLPDGVWWNEAPQGSRAFVIVTLQTSTDEPMFTGERAWEDTQYMIKAVEFGTSGVNAVAAAARIDQLLDNVDIPIDGYLTMRLQRDGRIHLSEVDDLDTAIRWQHRGGNYRIVACAADGGPQFGPPQSAFDSLTPQATTSGDYTIACELSFASSGQITALRFYHVPSATRTTRTLRLWRVSDQALLASVDTVAEVSGWNTITLTPPVPVTAGDHLLVGLDAYAPDPIGYSDGVASDTTAIGFVQSLYGTRGLYPTAANATYYFTDVVFQAA